MKKDCGNCQRNDNGTCAYYQAGTEDIKQYGGRCREWIETIQHFMKRLQRKRKKFAIVTIKTDRGISSEIAYDSTDVMLIVEGAEVTPGTTTITVDYLQRKYNKREQIEL